MCPAGKALGVTLSGVLLYECGELGSGKVLEQLIGPVHLGGLCGYISFVTTRRYVHPNMETGRPAMESAREARGGHTYDRGAIATKREVPLTN